MYACKKVKDLFLRLGCRSYTVAVIGFVETLRSPQWWWGGNVVDNMLHSRYWDRGTGRAYI